MRPTWRSIAATTGLGAGGEFVTCRAPLRPGSPVAVDCQHVPDAALFQGGAQGGRRRRPRRRRPQPSAFRRSAKGWSSRWRARVWSRRRSWGCSGGGALAAILGAGLRQIEATVDQGVTDRCGVGQIPRPGSSGPTRPGSCRPRSFPTCSAAAALAGPGQAASTAPTIRRRLVTVPAGSVPPEHNAPPTRSLALSPGMAAPLRTLRRPKRLDHRLAFTTELASARGVPSLQDSALPEPKGKRGQAH